MATKLVLTGATMTDPAKKQNLHRAYSTQNKTVETGLCLTKNVQVRWIPGSTTLIVPNTPISAGRVPKESEAHLL